MHLKSLQAIGVLVTLMAKKEPFNVLFEKSSFPNGNGGFTDVGDLRTPQYPHSLVSHLIRLKGTTPKITHGWAEGGRRGRLVCIQFHGSEGRRLGGAFKQDNS